MNSKLKLLVLCTLLAGFSCSVNAQGTTFTYQGRLSENGALANGASDFTFTLYNAAGSGATVGTSNVVNDLAVSNGLFTVTLDFGAAFDGSARWLEIAVRPGASSGAYTNLVPRQPITAAPYAMRSLNAGTAALANSVAAGTVNNSALASDAVDGSKILNGSITSADLNTSLLNSTFWKLGGNAGTTPGTHFVGTSDNQALQLKVNNTVALQISPGVTVPNVVGGMAAFIPTVIGSGVSGAVVAGGNAPAAGVSGYGGGDFHAVYDSDGTIGGGFGNKVGTDNANPDDAPFATIAGGVFNSAFNYAATVAGGDGNTADGNRAAVLGGYGNRAGGTASAVGGGQLNKIEAGAHFSSIGGGQDNSIRTNTSHSIIAGGTSNLIQSGVVQSVISGGAQNTITLGAFGTVASTISGGTGNIIKNNDARYATISGGYGNTNSEVGATVGGGYQNTASGAEAAVAGGYQNIASGGQATIAGGTGNVSSGQQAAVGGGQANTSSGNGATVGGGSVNISSGYGSTVGGGYNNSSTNQGATISGGGYNIGGGLFATVPGGYLNNASGHYSFAAGYRAKASHVGAFVWADNTFADFASTADNQFCVRASGGVRIQGANNWNVTGGEGDFRVGSDSYRFKIGVSTGGGGAGDIWMRAHGGTARVFIKTPGGTTFYSNEAETSGVSLAPNGTAWAIVSDRNVKKDFAAVDSVEILEKLAAMPITQWHYNWESADVTPHIGPMAQDFKAAFYPGADDKSITTQEADGVALAAIQGLNQKLEATRAENAELKARLEKLERLISQKSGGGQ